MAIQQRVEVPPPPNVPAPLWQLDQDSATDAVAQRSVLSPSESEQYLAVEERSVLAPTQTDRYVTVDERVENTIGVVFAPWPSIDEYGLRFLEQPDAAWFDAGDLQTTIDQFRDQAGEVPRPLRIGDTFWVRGFSAESAGQWEAVRDVTPQARTLTKAAVALAALGAVQPPVNDLDLAAEGHPIDAAAGPVAQVPGGPATARPTI